MYAIFSVDGGPKRVNHAAAAVGHRIYSFGGHCSDKDYNGSGPIDVHIFDTLSVRWLQIEYKADSTVTKTPLQRYGHTVVAYGDCIYLFGGRNDNGACNVLYKFDTVTHVWSQPLVYGLIPNARDGHSSCVVGNSMYVFGGYEDVFDSLSQDLFCLNLETFVWMYVPNRGIPPTCRDFHTASNINGRMYVFGGRSDMDGPVQTSEESYDSNIVYFDTCTLQWVVPEVTGEIPEGRRSHSAFVLNDKLYIFGGYNGDIKQHYNDLYCFNPAKNSWSRSNIKGQLPCPRRRHCCCLIDNRIYIFGGTSPRLKNWEKFASLTHIQSDVMLVDHSDLYVIDISPNLKTLCLLAVIENDMDTNLLPKKIPNI
ncbi:kelch domain-containing protein 3-like protein [Leptotrombidium deliense]|uniref:Kelch domain-containing protein 3-like protein n=1 Tax=Leptotrombidium deliense TaxID=299467 RepID=A0A443SMK0_9ACAR|nr:kelch domain-containing protein 3-like protein [Leptotrombidium deliense]